MLALKEFEKVSGLRINKEKTKVAKIGGWGDNGTNLCDDLLLDWTQEFTALGISYNVNNMEQITELNTENKIIEIQKLIYLWNARNVMPYGKIIIIKSLLISKITHVLLSLPSPNQTTINKLENMFKNFLWGKNPPKFRKNILENLNNLRGMKMTNLKNFDYSLKISWLKRITTQTEGWVEFLIEMGIQKVIKYGDQYLTKLKHQLDNKFWIDMINGIQVLTSKFRIKNAPQLYSMPLWHNSRLQFEYRQDWEKKGIKYWGTY